MAADPAMEFPTALSDLPNPPSHLAVDPKTGDLWFLIFTYDGTSNTLYHYSAVDGKVETFEIPSDSGSELYSAISVDSRGHVISAEGSVITDFDPASGEFINLALPEPATKAVGYSPSDGAWVLDMAISDSGLAYLSRMNIPAITEFGLSTGESRELPYPSTFGPAYDIELGDDAVWMTSVWNIIGLSTAQTGRIDPVTGEFTAVGPATTAISAGRDEAVLGVRASSAEAPTADLVEVSAAGFTSTPVAPGDEKARLVQGLGIRDFMTVAPATGAVWVTGEGSGSVFRVISGSVREYNLPVYGGFAPRCDATECPDANLRTAIRGLAAAPNGDLYFSDATLSRVGVIRADQ